MPLSPSSEVVEALRQHGGIGHLDRVHALVLKIDLPFLAREINDAHGQVKRHARGMLLEAKRAGEALLEAKKMIPHGGFKAWVEANCGVGYRQARKYMAVTKLALEGHFDPSQPIDAFLEAHAQPRPSKPEHLTQEDAEYVLKIVAMAERGEEAERLVAAALLEKLAARRGMEVVDLISASRLKLPDLELTAQEAERQKAGEELTRARAELAKMRAELAELRADPERLAMLIEEASGEWGEAAGAEIGRLRYGFELHGLDWRAQP